MRNFNRTLFSLFFLLFASCLFAKVEVGGIFYRLDKNNFLAYVTYKGETPRSEANEYYGPINIPRIVEYQKDSFLVVGIDSFAFSQCDRLISVYIPSSVKKIELSAFRGCSSLRRIVVSPSNSHYYSDEYGILYSSKESCLLKAPELVAPNIVVGAKVDSFAPYAFNNCKLLKEVSIRRIDSLPEGLFQSCSNLRLVHLPPHLRVIGDRTFYGCSKLKQVTGIYNISRIGDGAFEGCLALKMAFFSDSLTEIGSRAFFSCNELEYLFLPSSLKKIGTAAFANCPMLSYIDLDKDNPLFSIDGRGVLFSKDKSILYMAPNFKNAKYVIPASVKSIKDSAFYGNEIELLKLPPNLKEIKSGAFMNCSYLTEITLPPSLTSVGQNAFSYCRNLKRVVCESLLLQHIDESVFAGGNPSRSYILPYQLKDWERVLKKDSISYCDMSYHIQIQNEERVPAWFTIKKYPTVEDSTATIVVTPDLGYHFLHWGDKTESKEKVLTMNRNYFLLPKLESLWDTIDGVIYEFSLSLKTASVVGYDDSYFASFDPQQYVVFEQSIGWKGNSYIVTGVRPYAFQNNRYVKNVVISHYIRTIGEGAFQNCENLELLMVPESVTNIGYNALANCRKLTLILPHSWETMSLDNVFGKYPIRHIHYGYEETIFE